MSNTDYFRAEQFLTSQGWQKNVCFTVTDGVIDAINTASNKSETFLKGAVVPGFIDTQVNGGGGVLFNHSPTVDTLKVMVNTHLQNGTTAMTPTVITDSFDVMCAAADAVATAISLNQHPLSSSIVGIHFEGPGLSQPKRGIHPTQHIRNIHNNELELFLRKDIGQVNVTVAPESCSPDLIKMLVANGVIVSLGHTNCDADTALRAIEAGATGATHIYNAMSGLTAREPGVIGTVLTSPSVYAGLIADMHHVHPTSCKLAFIAKGASRIMLVTDAMAHAGSDLQSLNWHEYQISKQGDKLTLADGTLAGSCLTMIDAVKLAVTNAGISLADALCSASQTPARFLNLTQHGTLEPGNYANFVVLSEHLSIESVWLHGVRY